MDMNEKCLKKTEKISIIETDHIKRKQFIELDCRGQGLPEVDLCENCDPTIVTILKPVISTVTTSQLVEEPKIYVSDIATHEDPEMEKRQIEFDNKQKAEAIEQLKLQEQKLIREKRLAELQKEMEELEKE